jgi:hypothetical protein
MNYPIEAGLNPRQTLALELRKAGGTFSQIASALGVSLSRAAEIYRAAERKAAIYDGRASDPLYGLSQRARYCLLDAGFDTREKITAAISSGAISEKCDIERFSTKLYIEVCAHVGIEPSLTGKRRWKFDPYTGKPL